MDHAQTTHDSGHTLLDGINGDKTPVLAISNGVNGTSAKINGNSVHNLPSPVTDSPSTPVSNIAAPDVKIDIDYQEQESDVRHEPLPIKTIDPERRDNVSLIAQVGTPIDPSTIPIHPPSGTPPPPPGELLEDVKMAEATEVNGSSAPHVNGQQDIVMAEDNVTPSATPGISQDFSMASIDGASTSATRSYPDDSDDREPPAKRARTHTDADMASTAHSATPPPPSASPAPPPPSAMAPATASSSTTYPPVSGDDFPLPQWRFCLSTVKNLKKQKDSGPFQLPVDPVALSIPHYPSIIKTPMDLATVERKLHSSNYQKPDTNPNNPRYYNVQEFIKDVHLIFNNAYTFNGPEHVVTAMGKRLREIFDKQIKNIPAVEAPPKPIVKKVATPPPPPPPAPVVVPKKAPVARRPSTSVPVIRRSEAEPVGRPKREIHPPPPKDLPYADVPKKHRKGRKVKDDGTAEQLKFCAKLLADLHRKQHWGFANPFYEPVDWQKLDLPNYPKIVRKPMDLSTIRRKLEAGEYPSSQDFYNDFKLMIRNCFLFNPAGTPVNLAGQDLQRLFDEKWRSLPQPRESEDEEEDEEDSEEDDRQRKIAVLERKKSEIEAEIHALKNPPPKEKKKKEKKEKPPVASTSKAPKQPKATSSKKKSKKTVADDDVLSFEQKKDLSEAIGKLDGQRLERVIQIIHEGVPEIRDSTEEIELEIDLLPATVLTKLYNYVLRPLRQPAQPKRSRQGKGTGTGGLKRKSMDEEKEAEKIRQLEERMALFENGGVAPAARPDDSDRSSDSSSGDDSSGSDSE